MSIQRTRLLGYWRNEGPQAAGTLWQPTASEGRAELGVNEVAEITRFEVIAPEVGGVSEDLMQIWPVLDGVSRQNYVIFPGKAEINVFPVATRVLADGRVRRVFELGRGVVESLMGGPGHTHPALENSTLKYTRNLTIIAQAGANPITQPYEVYAYGYVYNDTTLKRLGVESMSMNFTIHDRLRDRDLKVPGPTSIPISVDGWDQLPGGIQQDATRINPFLAFATNTQQTVENTEYQFRFELGNTPNQWQSLYWDNEVSTRILIIRQLGVKAHANLKYAWLRIFGTGDPQGEENPPGRILITPNNNLVDFGRISTTPELYLPIQQLMASNAIIARDRAVVSMQDDGTPIPPDSVTIAVAGVMIELPSWS